VSGLIEIHRSRPIRATVLALAALAVASSITSCGSASDPDRSEPAASDEFYRPPTTTEPGFDPLDPAVDLLPESNAAEDAFMKRVGNRRDFRIPRSAVSDLPEGPLARAVIARIWHELETPSAPDPRYNRLNPGQRALYVLQWADAEILNGGFDEFWAAAGYFAPDLVSAARRVGAPEFEALFRDAAALFPSGRIPRDRDERQKLLDGLGPEAVARLDERYFEFQYHRRTALGLILGRYVKTHENEFFA
jgi:hypothetical protein